MNQVLGIGEKMVDKNAKHSWLLWSYSIFLDVRLEDVIEGEASLRKKYTGEQYGRYSVQSFETFPEAFVSLGPLTKLRSKKVLVCETDSGATVAFTNCVPGGGFNLGHPVGVFLGCNTLSVYYEIEPWNYLIKVLEGGRWRRSIRSKNLGEGEVLYANSRAPFEFENPEVFSRLEAGEPIGPEEIYKFNRYFGVPVPADPAFGEAVKDIRIATFGPVGVTPVPAEIEERLLCVPW